MDSFNGNGNGWDTPIHKQCRVKLECAPSPGGSWQAHCSGDDENNSKEERNKQMAGSVRVQRGRGEAFGYSLPTLLLAFCYSQQITVPDDLDFVE